jgi:mannitol-1-phosphate 5-dehydrogenase
MDRSTFVGIGFGPIQAGLFLYEAYRSGNFERLVVAEVLPDVVGAVRAGGGTYHVNVATANGIERHTVSGVEILNPRGAADAEILRDALAEAREIATALPSVKIFGAGGAASVAALLAEGLRRKLAQGGPRAVIYAGENHNHAAELLHAALTDCLGADAGRVLAAVQCLNTVIGKMSGVVTDAGQIAAQGLAPVTDTAGRAFLVEAFNRILITRIAWPDFRRGLAVFEEKDDLLPFEEAKLYGHNATHALLGYLAHARSYAYAADVRADAGLMELTRTAFIEESGAALCRKYRGLDPLFTPAGYRAYVDDLMDRMTNPHLCDAVERLIRDPRRKLGWDDRLVGTLRLALGQGIRPWRYARGAAAAVRYLSATERVDGLAALDEIWREAGAPAGERQAVRALIAASDEAEIGTGWPPTTGGEIRPVGPSSLLEITAS